MLSGLIVYSKEDKQRNAWFIDRCIDSLANKGISLIYVDEDDALDCISNQKVDFAIYRGRNYVVLSAIEAKGIRCFNNSETNKIANDKYLTYQYLHKQNIACIPSFLNQDEVDSYPMIMKSVDGHGGEEVFLLKAKEDANCYKKPGKTYIYQRYYENKGDLRLYVLNKKVIGAVLRHNDTDYRSNFSLGGEVEKYQPEEELIKKAIKIATLLNADYIGVDFLKVGDQWLVNEIEDPVGARMLFKTSGIDVSVLLTDYISNSL